MQIWLNVSDANGTRLGVGPVFAVMSAEITRVLDGAGSWSARVPGVDARAGELLQPERRVQLWSEIRGETRLLGEGIIRQARLSEGAGGVQMEVSGPDILDELKRRNVLLARIYRQKTVRYVMEDLIALVPGWTVEVADAIGDEVVDARFDGVSILKAMQEIVQRYGYHLRMQAGASRVLEVGVFGDASGLRINRVETVTREALANGELLMVEQISRDEISEEMYNWLLPIGAGEGEAALTLEGCTRTEPYAVRTMTGPDGRTLYYVADDASIGEYGEIRKVGQFKEIAALSNSDADLENAANALYDAAVEALARHAVVQAVYGVGVKQTTDTIVPGDLIRMDYLAQVEQADGSRWNYLDVRGDFHVLRVREVINLDNSGIVLEISNVDRYPETPAQAVVGSIEQIELRNLKPGIVSSTRSYVYDREIAPGFVAAVPIEFTDATLRLLRVRVRVKTSPFRATATTAAAGGDHRHRVMTTAGTLISPIDGYSGRVMEARKADLTTHSIIMVNASNDDMWTEGASGTHTHGIAYGISDDTQTPTGITVWVNGVDRTAALTGLAVLAAGGGNLDVVLDAGVLSNLISGAAGGLRQVHVLEVRCAGGQGRAEVTVEIFEVTQAIRII